MPRKRKTSPDHPPPPRQLSSSALAEPRRATRQTPIPPPLVPQGSSRVHSERTGIESVLNGVTDEAAGDHSELVATQVQDQQQPPVKRGRGRPPKNPVQPSTASPAQPTIEDDSLERGGQRWRPSTSAVPLPDTGHLAASKENIQPVDHMAVDPIPRAPHGASTAPTPGFARPQVPAKPPVPRGGSAQSPVAASAAPLPSASTPQAVKGAKPTTPAHKQPRPDRNIEKVVFGDLCFRTWYPSYYGKEVLGDTSGNATKGSKDGAAHDAHMAAAMRGQTKHKQEHTTMLDRLYICPSCFKYSKEIVAWWGHVRVCEQKGRIPGRKIYVHPKGTRTILVPVDKVAIHQKKRKGEAGVRHTEEVVQDEGEWSIWEVDGEKDGLFCQNLSLFAKLWLDNKSVFFDVTGFNYFLLVYTPPPPKPQPDLDAEQQQQQQQPKQHPSQVVGFFSKEKMSWDNNNLACILIFPPWQRKGLGALLMGASYEISRREGVMGGPEKPISELGRKGYKRFWAGEIARWFLSLEHSTDEREVIIDINDCSQATWIAPEDCLATLREMDVYEDAGLGRGKPPPAPEDEPMEDSAEHEGGAAAEGEATHGDGDDAELVTRVRIDKETIRRYVKTYGISLERSCDADGFVEGYAVKVEEEDEDEEMGG